jgi:hypothetical protein
MALTRAEHLQLPEPHVEGTSLKGAVSLKYDDDVYAATKGCSVDAKRSLERTKHIKH